MRDKITLAHYVIDRKGWKTACGENVRVKYGSEYCYSKEEFLIAPLQCKQCLNMEIKEAKKPKVLNVSEQICSFGLAKRLKKLEVPFDSANYWRDGHYGNGERVKEPFRIGDGYGIYSAPHKTPNMTDYPAYSVAELGFLLQNVGAASRKTHSGWRCECDVSAMTFYADTEADARAKMLIHLLEKKYPIKY